MTVQNPVLRRAGPADAAAVRDLTLQAYAKWVPVMGREPRPMVADYDRAVLEHRIDLAEDGGELLALVETVLRPDDLLLVNLAVAPDRQGLGLGRRLLAHTEGLARAADRPAVRLYTNKLMAANVEVYGRHGYAVERLEEGTEVGTVVHMVKVLGQAGPS